MSILNKLFGRKEKPILSYHDFWSWFKKNERTFFKAVKNGDKIEASFFDKLSPKLDELKDGFFYLTGMFDDDTAELVLTADGNTRNIVFIEEIIAAAPIIDGWKFTALKPALNIKDLNIEMSGYKFDDGNISFYTNELAEYPDEIDITIIHNALTEDNRIDIVNGVYIFLDNYLGELEFLTNIDNTTINGKDAAPKDLIPISKLKDFLNWRQKEFIEKYEGVRYDTENDTHSILEAEVKNGKKLIAVVNTELLNWDSKASHPWVAALTIKYKAAQEDGLPNDKDYTQLEYIEETILEELKDIDGYLYIGRQTADGEREIYFACKDFRKPSKVFYNVQKTYSKSFEIDFEIYKDKYWQSFNKFNNT